MLERVQGDIKRRKLRHVDVCLRHNVEFETRSTGFERFDLPYQALPETDLAEIDTKTDFLGKRLAAPVLIGAMTGGPERSAAINQNLAIAAQHLGVGLMLGSQRVMLERAEARSSFQVRRHAPNILLVGNLGVAQLNRGYGRRELENAVSLIEADALALHTNPLQEALQQGGDTNFKDLVGKLREVVPELEFPVVLKEVGHGLSGRAAASVADAGFAALDVAGAGGTSWAKVEEYVNHGEVRHRQLVEWGIPTAAALAQVHAAAPALPLIASGGIRTGSDAAKALALGARVVAVALPLLRPATVSPDAVADWLQDFIWQLRVAMHGVGAGTVAALAEIRLLQRD